MSHRTGIWEKIWGEGVERGTCTHRHDWVCDAHCAEERWEVVLAEVVPRREHCLRVLDEDEGDERLCSGGGEDVGRHGDDGRSGQATSGLAGFPEVAHVAGVGVIDPCGDRMIAPLFLGSVFRTARAMHFASLLPFAFAASPSRVRVDGNTCAVTPIGGGQDDGPNIIRAFDVCKSGGTIILDRHYVVNTVLVITGLQDVSIELSGVGASPSLDARSPCTRSTCPQSSTPPTSHIGHPTPTIWSTRTCT